MEVGVGGEAGRRRREWGEREREREGLREPKTKSAPWTSLSRMERKRGGREKGERRERMEKGEGEEGGKGEEE